MLSCSIWFFAPSFWMGGGLESRCVGHVYGANGRTAPSALHTRPMQRLSRPPPIQKLGAQNHMLQLNIWCSWWWAYIPKTCRAKDISIKLSCCIKLAFHIISRNYKFYYHVEKLTFINSVRIYKVRNVRFYWSATTLCFLGQRNLMSHWISAGWVGKIGAVSQVLFVDSQEVP